MLIALHYPDALSTFNRRTNWRSTGKLNKNVNIVQGLTIIFQAYC